MRVLMTFYHPFTGFLDPEKKLFSHRILSRDECIDPFSKTGNLRWEFHCLPRVFKTFFGSILYFIIAKHMIYFYSVLTANYRWKIDLMSLRVRGWPCVLQLSSFICVSRLPPPRQESFPLWRLDGLHNRRPRGCVEVCTKPHHCEKIHLLPGHRGHQRPSWIARSSDGKERYSSHTSFITLHSTEPKNTELMTVYAILPGQRNNRDHSVQWVVFCTPYICLTGTLGVNSTI